MFSITHCCQIIISREKRVIWLRVSCVLSNNSPKLPHLSTCGIKIARVECGRDTTLQCNSSQIP